MGELLILKHAAWKDGDYRRLWLGAACNNLGMSGEQVILGLLVFQITQSTAWVGIILALYFLPMLVFGVLSGMIADRLDRRTLLRRIELLIATNLAVFAFLIAAGFTALWVIIVFSLMSGSLRALHQPVRISYAYDIVGGEQVVAGLGLLSLGGRTGQLIGALLAGALMERLGPPQALFALALVHGVSLLLFSRLRSAGLAAGLQRVPVRQNLHEYLQELRRNRVLLVLVLVTAAVEVFGFSFSTALPELATQRFGLGAEGLGLMHAARASGGIVASIAIAWVGVPRHRGRVFIFVILAFGASLLFLSAASHFVLAIAALVLVAGFAAASDVLTQSMVQLSVANALRGRAMGAWVFAIGASPLGHLEMGALAVALGIGPALLANGLALVLVGLFVLILVPRMRRL